MELDDGSLYLGREHLDRNRAGIKGITVTQTMVKQDRNFVVPAAEGRAVQVDAGESIRITTPRGGQAADFFAYNADDTAEWLSPNHTWVTTFSVKPRVGDVLISRFRNPMVRVTADNADGVHDMMIAACDQARYEFFGFEGYHRSCSENLVTAMGELGVKIDVIPQPVNFFTHTRVDEQGNFLSPPNPVPAGASVELEALIDLVCVVSSCPFDLPIEGWTINAGQGPTELEVEVF